MCFMDDFLCNNTLVKNELSVHGLNNNSKNEFLRLQRQTDLRSLKNPMC